MHSALKNSDADLRLTAFSLLASSQRTTGAAFILTVYILSVIVFFDVIHRIVSHKGVLKMPDLTIQDLTMTDQITV